MGKRINRAEKLRSGRTLDAESVYPRLCPHCKKAATKPPQWIKMLAEMRPPNRGPYPGEPIWSPAAMAKKCGIKRPRGYSWTKEALAHGVIEPAKEIAGASVYRRTQYGRLLLASWLRSGWDPNKPYLIERRY
jgi:hypothetical protein